MCADRLRFIHFFSLFLRSFSCHLLQRCINKFVSSNTHTQISRLKILIFDYIAGELQALVREEEEEERKNPEIIFTEGWVRVFDSEHYSKVLDMGPAAMKPLYWIIYKSPNAGMYEYICANALYELSGFDFSAEDGTLTWKRTEIH